MNVINMLLKLLAIGENATPIAKVAGIVNFATLTPLILWLWAHRDEQVTFTASIGMLCLLAVVGTFYIELLRRTNARKESDDESEQPR